MQVSSAATSRLANIPLALQSGQGRVAADRPVEAVERRDAPPEQLLARENSENLPPDLDDKTERKLGRIKEVQVAFIAALNMANMIENEFLLDPIV